MGISIYENEKNPKAGEIWLADLPDEIGHKQKGRRPVFITSNNIGNFHSPVVKGIPMTHQKQNNTLPTHAKYLAGEAGLSKDTVLLAEQEDTIDKMQLVRRIGMMNDEQILRAASAMAMATPIVFKAFQAGVQNSSTFQRIASA